MRAYDLKSGSALKSGKLKLQTMEKIRCSWPRIEPKMIAYHDEEWGFPLHNDQKLFEFMLLDAFQAGLSWKIILLKRENFRKAFDGFDAQQIALYGDEKIEQLMKNEGIVRNRLKISATINNARHFLRLQKQYGTFDAFIWQFTQGKPIVNHFHSQAEIPSRSPESDAMSKALIREGFKFVGSTICYAFMQGAGMINDHLVSCFRHPDNN